jgi:hypothetical protein
MKPYKKRSDVKWKFQKQTKAKQTILKNKKIKNFKSTKYEYS